MKKDRANSNPHFNADSYEDFDEGWTFDDVVSSTECTGLIPTAPEDDAESQAYDSIYDFAAPEDLFGPGTDYSD